MTGRLTCRLGVLFLGVFAWSCSEPTDTVESGEPSGIVLSAASDSLTFIGETLDVTARVTTATGSVVSNPAVTWSSTDPGIVSINGSGTASAGATVVVTAIGVGRVSVAAEVGGFTDSIELEVVQVPAFVSILPDTRRFEAIGDTARYEVVLSDRGGTDIPGTVAAWSTLDASVISLTSDGFLETVGNGYAHATLSVGGVELGVDFVVAAPVVFRNASVVDMLSPVALPSRDVVVQSGTITEVGPSGSVSFPSGAFEIDAAGLFLMPGLADMHIHMTCDTQRGCANDLFLFLANGVTTVRTMWGSTFQLRARNEIEEGTRVGPTMFVASPGMDGPGGEFTTFTDPILDAEQARTTVRGYADAGYDFIKAYNRISDAVYAAMHEEAASRGIKVLGHKPFAVTSDRIFSLGHWTAEHLLTYEQEASSTGSIWTSEPDLGAIRTIAARAVAAGVAETPTTAPFLTIASEVPTYRASEEARYTSPGVIDFSTNVLPAWSFTATQRETRIRRQRAVIGVLHEAGVPILLGTDAGVRWVLPGFSIHDELEELVAAGLTPYEAIRAGTVTAAEYLMSAGDFGVIRPGSRADLILLGADPLLDVSNVRRRIGVMVRGTWLTDGAIRTRLDAIAAEYGR